MKIEADLFEIDRVSKNGRAYSKKCLERYFDDCEEQIENNAVPVIIREYDEYGFAKSPIERYCKTIGAGTVCFDGNRLKFSGYISDNIDISGKFCVSSCMGDIVEEDDKTVVSGIVPGTLSVEICDICDSSAYFDESNIRVVRD